MRPLPLLPRGRRRSLRLGLCLRSFGIREPPFVGGFFVCGGFESNSFDTGYTEVHRVSPRVFSWGSYRIVLIADASTSHGISNVGTVWIEGTRFEFWHGNVWRGDRIFSRLGCWGRGG